MYKYKVNLMRQVHQDYTVEAYVYASTNDLSEALDKASELVSRYAKGYKKNVEDCINGENRWYMEDDSDYTFIWVEKVEG